MEGAIPVRRETWREGAIEADQRLLAEEVAVSFTYDGAAYAVMMATPADLEEFAIGFSTTEGIIATPADILDLAVVPSADGVVVRMTLAEGRRAVLVARHRRLAGPSGCGLCGLDSLAEARRTLPRVTSALVLDAHALHAAAAALPALQPLNRATAATHAAGFWQGGRMVAVREDVGRHNALDKLAGALLRGGIAAGGGVVVMSSRLSVELVQKAAILGVPVLAGISAPTALAVRTAQECGITLVGVLRGDGFEVFCHPDRLIARDDRDVA